MGVPRVVEPQESEEPAARRQGHDEGGPQGKPLLQGRRQSGLSGRRFDKGREPQGDQPLGEPRDLRLLDGEAVERGPPHPGGERTEGPELACRFVIGHDRAPIDADEAGRHADNQGGELFDVREPTDHLGDAEEGSEDLDLADFFPFGHGFECGRSR